MQWLCWLCRKKKLCYFVFSGDSKSSAQRRGWRRGVRLSSLRKNKKLCKSTCWAQIRSLSGDQTHSLLSTPSSASCSAESGGETLFNPGVVKQKVTLFFGTCPLTSCFLPGLHSARCFQRIAQRLTTLWRCRDLCGSQAHFMKSNLMSEMRWNFSKTTRTETPTCSWPCGVRLVVRSFMWAAYVRMHVTPSLSSWSL